VKSWFRKPLLFTNATCTATRRVAAARTIQSRQRGIAARERVAKLRWFKDMNAQHQKLVDVMAGLL
jgi:hypothetical protein